MTRYLRLLAVQLRASALLAMQYRLDFVVFSIMSVVWTVTAIVPLVVLFAQRERVAGWTAPEALVVVAWFTALKGILEGAIQPALTDVVEQIRKGTLDFILLKPADAQFLVSTTKFDLRKVINLLSGAAIAVYAFAKLHRVPSLAAVALSLVLLVGAATLLYALWIVVISLAFVFVRVDNLSYLFASVYDAARWPSSVFRGAVAFLFTFVIPIAVMTTFPAEALLGRLPLAHAAFALLGAAAAFAVSRAVWRSALGRYTSAGG